MNFLSSGLDHLSSLLADLLADQGAKTTQRLQPAASRILRALTFLIVIVFLSTTRIPLPWLFRQLWPSGIWPFLDWSCFYRRRPSLRRLGAPAPEWSSK